MDPLAINVEMPRGLIHISSSLAMLWYGYLNKPHNAKPNGCNCGLQIHKLFIHDVRLSNKNGSFNFDELILRDRCTCRQKVGGAGGEVVLARNRATISSHLKYA